MSLLQKIKSPKVLKKFNYLQLNLLSKEIRDHIINVTLKNGGHIGPNLGVIELSIVLHYVFETPIDKFIFDVSHQCYTHKLLTGRQGIKFKNIRKTGGLSGFANREESLHDSFGAGHAGTALSASLGMAVARDINKTNENIISIIGDASLTCGITMEALNNISCSTKKLIIILNDNQWSISKNVGAIASFFNKNTQNYWKDKNYKKEKNFEIESFFKSYGISYIGPIDGHNIKLLHQYINYCKDSNDKIVLHILTEKGKGHEISNKNPEKFHGISSTHKGVSNIKNENISYMTYQDIFGETIVKYATVNSKIIAITAAMSLGTGLSIFKEKLPNQFFDVGIAEEHAVVFAAGLATQGIKPICAIYSTFLQRAFDPIIHDVCLQKLPIVFFMDRSGLSINDGPTHHGLFDISYLRCIPNTVIMQPKNGNELQDMIYTSLFYNGPIFIRCIKGFSKEKKIKLVPTLLKIGQSEILHEGKDILIWALGPMVDVAKNIAKKMLIKYKINICVINARFAKPIDVKTLIDKSKNVKLIITMEDHSIKGGLGSAVLEELQKVNIHTFVEIIGWPDKFIEHATSIKDLHKKYLLDEYSLIKRILNRYKQIINDK